MKKMFAALATAGLLFPVTASAQAAATAMERAVQLNLCNGADPISAEFLDPTNQLKVTCPSGSLTGNANSPLSGTALGGAATPAVIVGAITLIAIISDDGSVSTTTTSP